MSVFKGSWNLVPPVVSWNLPEPGDRFTETWTPHWSVVARGDLSQQVTFHLVW